MLCPLFVCLLLAQAIPLELGIFYIYYTVVQLIVPGHDEACHIYGVKVCFVVCLLPSLAIASLAVLALLLHNRILCHAPSTKTTDSDAWRIDWS